MELDYKNIGLKAGLEIHQQLEGKKLFCDCSTTLREDKPDFQVKRYLRAVAGESGKVDVAAEQEQKKKKFFVYQGYFDSTCLVELDEEPPHEMNKEALEIALQVSLMLKAEIVSAIQVMRKTVVDGSNTSGFQRTALVATDGFMKFDFGKVLIESVSIEEDAAKIIEKKLDFTTYRVDRLGIPLIEIGTAPDMKTPDQVKEVAAYIGMLLRSTGKVKRGLGTIRQDVNVSIKGGARVEIKGAQDLKTLPLLVENEAKRQSILLELKYDLIKRKFKGIHNPDIVDLTFCLKNTDCKFIKQAIDSGDKVLGISLEKLKGLLGKELMPNYRFGTELAGHAKVFGFNGIIHSDEDLKKYKFTDVEIKDIITKLDIDNKNDDAFVLVVGDAKKAKTMIKSALIPRINHALIGVPKEVRNANPDATSSYLRPMPGSSRMYPETDIPIILPEYMHIELPELIEAKIERISSDYGLDKIIAENLVKNNYDIIFEKIVSRLKKVKSNMTLNFVAEFLITHNKEIVDLYDKDKDPKKPYLKIDLVTEEMIIHLFDMLSQNKLSKQSLSSILYDVALGKNFDKAVDKYSLYDIAIIKKEIKNIISENIGLKSKIKDVAKLKSTLLGICMGKLKYNARSEDIINTFDKVYD